MIGASDNKKIQITSTKDAIGTILFEKHSLFFSLNEALFPGIHLGKVSHQSARRLHFKMLLML